MLPKVIAARKQYQATAKFKCEHDLFITDDMNLALCELIEEDGTKVYVFDGGRGTEVYPMRVLHCSKAFARKVLRELKEQYPDVPASIVSKDLYLARKEETLKNILGMFK